MIMKKIFKTAAYGTGFAAAVFIIWALLSAGGRALVGYRVFTVASASMSPAIPPGTLVITREVPFDTLKPGDVITFVSRDGAIYGLPNTHRIAAIKDGALITRGDANPLEDTLPVYSGDVLGRVVYSSAALGAVFSFVRRPAVVVFLAGAVLMALVLLELRKNRGAKRR